jgi:hypothetical protein
MIQRYNICGKCTLLSQAANYEGAPEDNDHELIASGSSPHGKPVILDSKTYKNTKGQLPLGSGPSRSFSVDKSLGLSLSQNLFSQKRNAHLPVPENGVQPIH